MSIYRSKEDASPFNAAQTVTQAATIIGVTPAEVVAVMATRSRPDATPSTIIDFSTAEIILKVFQEATET